MARAEKQQDGSVKVVHGPPTPDLDALNLAIRQIIAAGGRVWGDARGLNVADANGDIVGIFGDLSGLSFNDQPIPAGTTGVFAINGFFSGTLAAGMVKAENIDVETLSAIAANLGTVTAGQVQTPDGRVKFGQDVLGSGKHGMLVNDGEEDQVAVGDISGKMWRGAPLPSGTYGVWAPDGFISVSFAEGVSFTEPTATVQTTSQDYIDVLNTEVEFTLTETSLVRLYATFDGFMLVDTNIDQWGSVSWCMSLNDTDLAPTVRDLTAWVPTRSSGPGFSILWVPASIENIRELGAGTFTLKLRIKSNNPHSTAGIATRTLGVLIMKR